MADERPITGDDLGDTWILFRPLKSDVPPAIRFRQLLKAALRTWGLKAVRVSGRGPDLHGADEPSANGD